MSASTTSFMESVRKRMLNKGISAVSSSTETSRNSDVYAKIWSNPQKLEYICNIISVIYTILYPSSERVKFYMKGGNSIPLLKHKYGFIEPPLVFPSDFDLTVLVNPKLGMSEYNKEQANALNACLALMIEFCMNDSYVGIFDIPDGISGANPVHIYTIEGVLASNLYPNKLLNRIFDKFRTFELPASCPFEIYIRPNTVFESRVLDVGMIALRLRTPRGIPPIELFDISFTLWNPDPASPSRKNIARDWELTQFIFYDTPSLSVLVYDPLSAYIDMHIAARRNTRTNKRSKRLARAANLNETFHVTKNSTLKNRRASARIVLQRENDLHNILTEE